MYITRSAERGNRKYFINLICITLGFEAIFEQRNWKSSGANKREPSVPTELSFFGNNFPPSCNDSNFCDCGNNEIAFVHFHFICSIFHNVLRCVLSSRRKNSFPHLEVEIRAMCENDGRCMGPADVRSAAASRHDHHE